VSWDASLCLMPHGYCEITPTRKENTFNDNELEKEESRCEKGGQGERT
jgi:hypothetical protein